MASRVGVLSVFLLVAPLLNECASADEGSVEVINATTSQVRVRCKSGDDDLGTIYIEQQGDYYFDFKQNKFGTTFFFCTFQWGQFSKVVPVWKAKSYVDRLQCHVAGHCVWKVTQRGLYWATSGPLEPFYFYAGWDPEFDSPR